MVLCKFWAQGNCRKGSACTFEHPTNNRQNSNNNSSTGLRSGFFANSNQPEKWQLNDADIQSDLTNTRPKWILSAYGPGREAPAALFVENEYSPEEVRWRYCQQDSAGNGASADREAQQLWQKADTDMLNASRNVKDVQKFMEEMEKNHPNRYDFCKMDGTVPKDEFARKIEASSQSTSSSSPFGGATQAASANPFSTAASASSPSGQSSSTFGQPAQTSAFGQARTTPAFGQPAQASAFGQPAQQSAFGQPAKPSAFGQPSQPSAFGKPAFGQSSTPGQPAFGQTGFGQGAASQTGSRFGQPIHNQSPFGAPAPQTGSAFGQTSNLGQSTGAAPGFGAGTGFGQSAQPSGFGKPGFGSTAAPAISRPFGAGAAPNPNPFGSAAGQTNNASPFGGAGAQVGNKSPFGSVAPNAPSGGGFGTTNANTQQQANPFGQPQPQPQQQQPQNPNPFGQPQPQPQPQNQQPNPFGQPQQPSQQSPSPFGQTQQQPQQTNPFGQKQPQAQPASPFGQPQQPRQQLAAQNPFGQQPQTGFGVQYQPAAQTNPNPNPFGGTAQQTQQAQPTIQSLKPTDKPVQPLHYTQTLPPDRTQTGLDGKLSLYRNQPVQIIETYRPSAEGVEVKDSEYPVYNRPDRKGLERIWFPNGLQESTIQKLTRVTYDFQDVDDAYNQQVKDQYGYLFESGSFKDHVIPLVPPERGWIDYDF